MSGSGSRLVGAIEGGGTKFICAVATESGDILERISIATTDPDETLRECVGFLSAAERRHGPLGAIGFGCFGPIELRRDAGNFGCMLPTPKAGWAGADLLAPLRAAFDVPIELDTDVAAAALGEWRLGAGRGLRSVAYVTVGTGIGGAVVPEAGGGGFMHAEMGHLPVRRDVRDPDFAGLCPFHGDCLEGLASGPAIEARWGTTLVGLPETHSGTAVIAGYLGQLAASIALIAPVERIVFGGGVMAHPKLLPMIGAAALGYLNGYLEPLRDTERARSFVTAPALGQDSGIRGALLLTARSRRPPA